MELKINTLVVLVAVCVVAGCSQPMYRTIGSGTYQSPGKAISAEEREALAARMKDRNERLRSSLKSKHTGPPRKETPDIQQRPEKLITETQIGKWSLFDSGGTGITFSVTDHPQYGKQAGIFVSDYYVINTVMFTGVSKADLEGLKILINKTMSELSMEQRDIKKTKRVRTAELGKWPDGLGKGIRFSVEDHPRYGKQARIFVSDAYVVETVLFTGVSNVNLARLKTLINETIAEL